MESAPRLVPKLTIFRSSPISLDSSPSSPVDPVPNLPLAPSPQQATLESSRIAQVKSSPAVIAVAVLEVGKSTNAKLEFISLDSSPMVSVLPIPNCPAELSPQHPISPSFQSTHVWSWPNAILAISPLSGKST